MKRTFLVSVIFLASAPFITNADEATTSPVIHANVNVRYQGSLVWTGNVSLDQGSSLSVSDNTGTPRTIPSDSALSALVAADTISSDFNASDLLYYTDYSSFFVNCIDISATVQHACGNWQYVVNSFYPPVGADKHVIADNDTVYFYFGSPRRVSLPVSTADASTTVSVLVETYEHMNGTWRPLSNAAVGATQPNPDDQFSPFVRFTATSDSEGIARFDITTPGTYSVGIASDYYFPSELLTITTPPVVQVQVEAPRTSSSSSGRTGSTVNAPASQAVVEVKLPEPAKVLAEASDNIFINLDISIEDFIRNYNEYQNSHRN